MTSQAKKKIDQILDKKDFADALERGLGRAFLHLSKYGLGNFADLVLKACIHNQNYDTQCEPSRASWLFGMIKDRAEYTAFRSSILTALESETNGADLFQLCDLVKEMAQNGDRDAKRILRKCVLSFAKTPDKQGLGAVDLIDVYGNKAVLDLANVFGKRLLKSPGTEISYGFYCNRDIRKLLSDSSSSNPEIKAFWDYIVKSGHLVNKELTREQMKIDKQKRRRMFRKKYPLKKIIEDAQNGVGRYPDHYVSFGEYATERELKKICNQILTEQDEEVRMRLLWIFRRAVLPRYSFKYFNWANSEHKGLRIASIAALAQVWDKRVRRLARTKLKTCQILGADSEVLDLFFENYKSSDSKLIIKTLNSVKPGPDDAHNISLSIISLAENYKDPRLTDALIWVYENTPCIMCRGRIVSVLYELGSLNDSILRECLYDANEYTRKFARKINNKSGHK